MPRSPTSRGHRPGDVVIVPFPFTDQAASKRRPALVCSSRAFNERSGHLVLAMITTATRSPWPGDVAISDLKAAGLPLASSVRWKLFTLDATLIRRRAGALATRDRMACREAQPIAL